MLLSDLVGEAGQVHGFDVQEQAIASSRSLLEGRKNVFLYLAGHENLAQLLPKELQGALHSLYSHYEKAYQQWQAQVQDYPALMPPVFIVVCNNTRSSKLVFDYLAGWEKPLPAPDPATFVRNANGSMTFAWDVGTENWYVQWATSITGGWQTVAGPLGVNSWTFVPDVSRTSGFYRVYGE